MFVVPAAEEIELQIERFLIKRNDDRAQEFLESANESLDYGDAAVFANREAHCNQDTPYQKTGYNLALHDQRAQ